MVILQVLNSRSWNQVLAGNGYGVLLTMKQLNLELRKYRFFGEEKLEVVCQANPEYADSYGRVDFVFQYDFSHSSWTKKGLAYQ